MGVACFLRNSPAFFMFITVFVVSLHPSSLAALQVDGEYTFKAYRVWNDDYAPHQTDPHYQPGKTEPLYSSRFNVQDGKVEVREVVDHSFNGISERSSVNISVRDQSALRVEGKINMLFGKASLREFSTDILISDSVIAVTALDDNDFQPDYFLEVDLKRVTGAENNRRTQNTSSNDLSLIDLSAINRIRLAQTILATMGHYTSSIDGVLGSQTNEALTAGVRQLNSSAAPTVDNFLILALAQIDDEEALSAESQRRVAALNEQVATLRNELGRLQNLLDVAEDAKADSQLQIESLTQDLNSAVIRALAAERRARALEEVAQEQKDELGALRPLRAQNASLQQRLSAANGTVSDLRADFETDDRVLALQKHLSVANATVADLRDELEENYVPIDEYVELQMQIAALNASNVEIRERIESDFVPREDYVRLESKSREAQGTLRNQLAGVNQSVAELRDRMTTEYIPRADYAQLKGQLDEATIKNGELLEKMQTEYVAEDKFLSTQRQLLAMNETVSELRVTIENDYKKIEDYRTLERQVDALNATILELQDRNDRQRNRMIESERLFQNFREDCAALPSCAQAMQLD